MSLQWCKCKFYIPKRYVVLFMIFIGYANMFYLHSNLGMAVVEMTSVKNITHLNGTVEQKADFDWSSREKGIILGSFSYGGLFSPIGGVLSGKFGGSRIFSIGILITALVTFFSPILLNINFYLFVVCNVVLGAFEIFSYASVTQLTSRWCPPDERSTFFSLPLVGMSLGSGVSFIVSGWIMSTWNWKILFYVSGIALFVWYWIWLLIVKNDPSEDKQISDVERSYIKEKINCNYSNEKLVYPWKKILTCVPFWIACLAKFVTGCGYTFTFMYMPQYIKDTNNIDIEKIGYISMVPQICAVISGSISGCIGDYMRSHKILSVTNIHKLLICSSTFGTAVAFMFIVLWSNLMVRIIAVSVIQFCITYALMTILVLFVDLTPKYASLLNSIANVFYTGSGIVTPILVGFIVTSHYTYCTCRAFTNGTFAL
ncbi:vesicular glutamate transporter 3-like isoform X2 [Planococcus citri]|uniref:vesicular glutamate transporter 3-like isoform X2 n=1 Tax=Planococcus citri TaxID=170843 RepID=UPI0031F8F275